MKKSDLGTDYLFFRGGSYYLLIILPLIASNISRFRNASWEVENELFENQLLDSAKLIKISIGLLLSIILAYRWTLIQNNGTYSFWLSQGMTRKQLLLTVIRRFIGLILFIYMMELLVLYIGYGIYYSISQYAFFLIFISISYFFVLTLILILSDVIKNPELSAVSMMLIMISNFVFANDLNKYIYMTINPESQVFGNDLPSAFILSVSISVTSFLSLYTFHSRRDLLY